MVLKSKILRSCKLMVDFMKNTDQYKFGYNIQVKNSVSGPKNVNQIKTLTGLILCDASEMAKQFTSGFNQFNRDYQWCNKQISSRCKNIERASKTLANEFFGLSTELDHLQKMIEQKVDIPQFSNLYQKMSDLMHMQGEMSLH